MTKKLSTVVSAVAVTLVVAASGFAQEATMDPRLPGPTEAPAGSPVAIHGHLKAGVVGGKGVLRANDGSGDAVTLRGMSLYWASSGPGRAYYNDVVVGWLAHDFNVSVVRAAIGPHKDAGGGGNGYHEDPDDMIGAAEAVIEAAIRRGIYVIVDWHAHDNQYQNKAVEFFTHITKKYGAYPNILYEPFNEPEKVNTNYVKTFVQPIINAIRTNGGTGPIIIGSPEWSSEPVQMYNDRPTDSGNNLAFSYHFYANDSWGAVHGQGGRDKISSAQSLGGAVFATEFGMTNADGGGGLSEPNTTTWIEFMEANHVGWANWSIVNVNESSAALTTSGTSGGPWTLSQSGNYMRGKIRQYNNSIYYGSSYTNAITPTVTEGGRVEMRKKGSNTVTTGPFTYNDTVIITPVPDAGYAFDGWAGEAKGHTASPVPSGLTTGSLAYRVVGLRNVSPKAMFWKTNVVRAGSFNTNLSVAGTTTRAWFLVDGSGTNLPLSTRYNEQRDENELEISAAGAAQLRHTGLDSLKAGVEYELSFWARAASPRTIEYVVTTSTESAIIFERETASLNTTMQEFNKRFTIRDLTPNRPSFTNGTLRFYTGGSNVAWYLDDVRIDSVGQATSISLNPAVAAKSWGLARTTAGFRLTGPQDLGAKATLYDTRGRVVRTMAARDGLTFGKGIPSGSYMLVVKNGAGQAVLNTRVMLAQ